MEGEARERAATVTAQRTTKRRLCFREPHACCEHRRGPQALLTDDVRRLCGHRAVRASAYRRSPAHRYGQVRAAARH